MYCICIRKQGVLYLLLNNMDYATAQRECKRLKRTYSYAGAIILPKDV